MAHVHTLETDTPRSTRVYCDGCDVALRLATADEAEFVHMTGMYREDGPMVGPHGVIVVPLDFSLYQEA